MKCYLAFIALLPHQACCKSCPLLLLASRAERTSRSELEAQQRVERKLFPSAKDKEREAEMKIIGGGAPAPNGSDRGGDRDDRRRRRDDRDDRGDDRDSRRRRYD